MRRYVRLEFIRLGAEFASDQTSVTSALHNSKTNTPSRLSKHAIDPVYPQGRVPVYRRFHPPRQRLKIFSRGEALEADRESKALKFHIFVPKIAGSTSRWRRAWNDLAGNQSKSA